MGQEGLIPVDLTSILCMEYGEVWGGGGGGPPPPLFIYIFIFLIIIMPFKKFQNLTEGVKLNRPQIFSESGPGWPKSGGRILSKMLPP